MLRFDGRSAERSELERMSAALAHRGPDGDGHAPLGPCGLAHRRLSILELSDLGRQPMATRDGRFWLTYNGEVYNYVELRRDLEGLGHRFAGGSDSEVVLAAYSEWGESAFSRFNGMWGMALWDTRLQRLLLSRDRLGVKPLYLHLSTSRLLFASEPKAILAAEPTLARVDRRNLARFVLRGPMAFLGDTFFEGIRAVEPGTSETFDRDGRSKRRRFWTFAPVEPPRGVTMADAAEQTRALLTDAVRLRYRSDVPVGTCLSGGIDSSSIVALASRVLGKAPMTFSVIYDDPECDEREFVDSMALEYDLDATRAHPDGSDFGPAIERATYFQDGPTNSHGIYSQWRVMQAASSRVKVLLDGQGGDELFAGYFSYFYPNLLGKVRRILRGDVSEALGLMELREEVAELSGEDVLASLTRNLGAKTGRLDAFTKLATRLSLDRPPRDATPLPRVLTEELTGLVRDERWATRKLTRDPLTNYLWETLTRATLPHFLQYEDRDSMAFSIEARTPFLDYRLVEHAFRLPNELKIQGATTKAVLREAMRGILPERVRLRRDKKGYPTPFGRWSRTGLREFIGDQLLSERARTRGVFDGAALSAAVEAHLAGHVDLTASVYQWLTVELFHRRFIDAPFRPDDPRIDTTFDPRPVSPLPG
ncbi:MAG: asparagine synthase (glutamine-hydrolyzing) [Deltaproteobacteria bacterium]|nr:asparagine synthase (glutamine-hydrolyzing) [Deltaproteobacteria bacterium]